MKDLENKDPGVHNLLLSLYAKKVNPLDIVHFYAHAFLLYAYSWIFLSFLQSKKKTRVLISAFSLFLLDMIMVVPDSLCIEAILLLLQSCHIHVFGSSFFF